MPKKRRLASHLSGGHDGAVEKLTRGPDGELTASSTRVTSNPSRSRRSSHSHPQGSRRTDTRLVLLEPRGQEVTGQRNIRWSSWLSETDSTNKNRNAYG